MENGTIRKAGCFMKKIIALSLSIILLLITCTGCQNKKGNENANDDTQIRIAALKGPTAMGMVKLMDDAKNGTAKGNFDFNISEAVDEITPMLVKGDVDIAAVPANLGAVLYNNTEGKVKVLAVNTLGVLYIVDNGDSVHSVADLKGKTIYTSGKGATPEYTLNYILKNNGIDPEKDVTIEYKSEHAECVAVLASQENAIAMLPQPFVTVAQAKNDKIRVALDMNEEWDKLQDTDNKSALITGAIVVRTEFLEQHKDLVNQFLDSYKESVDYVNNHIDDAAALIEKEDIVPAAVAKIAIPYCNIVYIGGDEMKTKLSGYYSVLFDQNPKSVGGTLPDDTFYYKR